TIQTRLVDSAGYFEPSSNIAGGIAEVSETERFEGIHGQRTQVQVEIQRRFASGHGNEIAGEADVIAIALDADIGRERIFAFVVDLETYVANGVIPKKEIGNNEVGYENV